MDMDMNSGLGHTQDLDGSSDAIIDALAHLNPDHGSSSAGHDNVHGLDSSFHLNQDTLQHHQHQDLQGVIDSVRESQNGQQSLQNTSNATGQRQDDDVDTMDIESLRTEVRRLRGIITSLSQPSHGFIDPSLQLPSEVVQPQTDANDSSVAKEGRPARSQKRKRAPRVLDESAAVAGADEDLHRTLDNRDSEKRARKTKSEPVRDEETGKRVEKSRKTELSKIVRATIRARLGINENDPLPAPVVDLVDLSAPFIPDWTTPLSEANTTWVEGIVSEVYDKAGKGLYTSLPLEDINEEVIGTTTRTAFSNMCRKYIVETDPNRAAKKEGYVKGRRRWARKDLKQKRRLKALSDPSFGNALPPAALHLDYMSSEYSSPGEDSDEEDTAGKAKRAEKWGEMMTVQAAHALNRASNSEEKGKGKGGWADGVQEKVLEVRTPRWRSNELNAMYRRLDAIAAMSSSARNSVTNQSMSMGIMSGNVKAGHVAPSHQRFVMPPPYGRRGKKPRDPGEGWMWQTGQVEVWPEVQEGDAPGEQEQPSNQLPEESQWTHEDTGALVDAIQGIPG